jgi:hypothetical protein
MASVIASLENDEAVGTLVFCLFFYFLAMEDDLKDLLELLLYTHGSSGKLIPSCLNLDEFVPIRCLHTRIKWKIS